MKWQKFGKKRKLSIKQIDRLLSDHDFERYQRKYPNSSMNEILKNIQKVHHNPKNNINDNNEKLPKRNASKRLFGNHFFKKHFFKKHSSKKHSAKKSSPDPNPNNQVKTAGLIDPNASDNDDTQFIDDFEAADQDFNKYTQSQYVRKFHFPYLASEQERTNLYKAHVSVRDAKNLLIERLIVTIFLGLGFGLAMGIILKKGFILSLLITLLAGGITWYALSSSIRSNYSNFKIDRQIAFNLFEKLLAPDLHRVVEGSNLTNILEDVSHQLPQPMYRHYVDRLVIDVQAKPNSKKPFDKFAHTFSGGGSAEYHALVFTDALFQLTQGKNSVDTINQLLKTSERQLSQQQNKIMKLKQRPFKLVEYLMFSTFFPFTIAYYGTTIASYISSFHM